MNMKVKIVFFGDSITEGQYIDQSERWSSRVENQLEKEFLNIDFETFNKGISGQTTRQALERFPQDVQEIQPDILTIQFGLNDCNYWTSDKGLPRVSLQAYVANIEEMIARAKQFSIPFIILSNNHPTLRNTILAGGKTLEESRLLYNCVLEEIAERHEIIFCNIDEQFQERFDQSYDRYLLEAPDLLHLSLDGHELYKEVIINPIRQCVIGLQNFMKESDKKYA